MARMIALLLALVPAALADVACVTSGAAKKANFPSDMRITLAADDVGKTTITAAKDFSVTYYDEFKYVENTRAKATYVLTLCGATAPTAFPNGTAFPAGAKHFTVPLTGVATGTTVPIAFMEMLGLRSKLKLVDPKNVHSPCVQKMEEAGTMDGHAASLNWSPHANWTKMINESSAITGVFTDSWGSAKSGTDKDISFDATSDPGLLKRTEWIKFMSLFFNKEPDANKYYTEEVKALSAISGDANKAAGSTKKKCAWIQYSSYSKNYQISGAAYKKDICSYVGMTAVAGATFPNATAFHAAIAGVDVLIDETYFATPTDATKAKVLESLGNFTIPAGVTLLRLDKRISDAKTKWYDSAAAGSAKATHGLDWFEGAVARPATVVADLAAEVYPSMSIKAGCSSYFRDVGADEKNVLTSAADCDAEMKAYDSGACASKPVTYSTPPAPAKPSPPPGPVVEAAKSGAAQIAVTALLAVLVLMQL